MHNPTSEMSTSTLGDLRYLDAWWLINTYMVFELDSASFRRNTQIAATDRGFVRKYRGLISL